MQFVGEPTCTLGEIKNRADLLIFWGCNPIVSHSRHFARYSVMPSGRFVQDGRESRKVVVVDVRLTQTARVADVFLQVKPGSDFELLVALKALVKGKSLDAVEVGGISIKVLEELVSDMNPAMA